MADEAVFQEIRDEWGANLSLVENGNDPLANQIPLSRIMDRELRVIDVLRAVCLLTGVTMAQIRGDRRQGVITRARYAIAYIARKHCQHATFQTIANQTGRFDHGTVLVQVRRAEELLATNAAFRSLISRVEFELDLT